jgi:hypothetical protein
MILLFLGLEGGRADSVDAASKKSIPTKSAWSVPCMVVWKRSASELRNVDVCTPLECPAAKMAKARNHNVQIAEPDKPDKYVTIPEVRA